MPETIGPLGAEGHEEHQLFGARLGKNSDGLWELWLIAVIDIRCCVSHYQWRHEPPQACKVLSNAEKRIALLMKVQPLLGSAQLKNAERVADSVGAWRGIA